MLAVSQLILVVDRKRVTSNARGASSIGRIVRLKPGVIPAGPGLIQARHATPTLAAADAGRTLDGLFRRLGYDRLESVRNMLECAMQ